MAAASVEVPMVGMMVHVSPSDQDQVQFAKLKMQNSYLSYTVTKKLLSEENLNGLHRQENRFTHEVINEPGFKGAVETLEKSCRYLKKEKLGEMDRLVGTMNITDSQLCTNFQRVSEHLMQEDIRFGRIGSLFFFTFVLSRRLYSEGRQKEVDSVIDWLAIFLDERISPWLMKNHQGQWVSGLVFDVVLLAACSLAFLSACSLAFLEND